MVVWSAIAALLLASCTPKPPPDRLTLAATEFTHLAGWREDGQGAALAALRKSCDALVKQAGDSSVGPGGFAGTAADWRAPRAQAALTDPAADAASRPFFPKAFLPFTLAPNARPT